MFQVCKRSGIQPPSPYGECWMEIYSSRDQKNCDDFLADIKANGEFPRILTEVEF